MNWQTHKKQLLKDPAFNQALKKTEPELQIARAVIEARLDKGLSQKELAHQLNTQQSVISRVESARTIPSLAFMKKVATVLNVSFQVTIWP